MPFLSPEQVAHSLSRHQRTEHIDELDVDIIICTPSANTALAIGEMQLKLEKGEITRTQMMINMVKAMCLDPKTKKPLTDVDAKQLLECLSIDGLTALMGKINPPAAAGGEVLSGNSEASPAAH